MYIYIYIHKECFFPNKTVNTVNIVGFSQKGAKTFNS